MWILKFTIKSLIISENRKNPPKLRFSVIWQWTIRCQNLWKIFLDSKYLDFYCKYIEVGFLDNFNDFLTSLIKFNRYYLTMYTSNLRQNELAGFRFDPSFNLHFIKLELVRVKPNSSRSSPFLRFLIKYHSAPFENNEYQYAK